MRVTAPPSAVYRVAAAILSSVCLSIDNTIAPRIAGVIDVGTVAQMSGAARPVIRLRVAAGTRRTMRRWIVGVVRERIVPAMLL